MGNLFSRINIPTFVAVLVFLAIDKKIGASDKLLGVFNR
jgi:hypothetical protein